MIGREKLSDIELPDEVKPSNSHVSLTTIVDDSGDEHEIVRFNMPFGRIGAREFGTYFIGYARSPAVIEQMLSNMFNGDPPGNYDRILDFSTAVTGNLFFVPDRRPAGGGACSRDGRRRRGIGDTRARRRRTSGRRRATDHSGSAGCATPLAEAGCARNDREAQRPRALLAPARTSEQSARDQRPAPTAVRVAATANTSARSSERATDVPLDPVPANLFVGGRCSVEANPDLLILDGIARGRLPALALPTGYPGRHAIVQVGESVTTHTRDPDGSAHKPSSAAAVISMMLFVVRARPPLCSSMIPSSSRAAQPTLRDPGIASGSTVCSRKHLTRGGFRKGGLGSDLDRRRGLEAMAGD